MRGILILLLPGVLSTQALQWVYTYEDASRATKLLYDGDNGVYVLGSSVIIKLDTLGNERWVYSGVPDRDMVLDGQGHIYLAGNGVAKMDTSGNLLWKSLAGVGCGIAIGNFGELYIASGRNDSFAVFSLDTTGAFRWSYSHDAGTASVITVDRDRGVYAGGKIYTHPDSALLLKLDTGGTPLWECLLGPWLSVQGGFTIHDFVLDSASYIYGEASRHLEGIIPPDPATIFKIDTAGNIAWKYDVPAAEFYISFRDVHLTHDGVYASGGLLYGLIGEWRFGVYGLDFDGGPRWYWVHEHKGPYCFAYAMASDPEGNLFLVGSFNDPPGVPGGPVYPLAVKLFPTGARDWEYPWPDSGAFVSVATDTSGGVYIAGTWNNDLQVIKLKDSLTTVQEGHTGDSRFLLTLGSGGFFISGYEGDAMIYDPVGRLVLSKDIKGKTLISPLRPGVYFVVAGKERARVAVR